MLSSDQVAALRAHFPILRDKTYLYNCSQGALSDAVESAIQDYANSWRSSSAPWDEWVGVYEGLRADIARLIHAEPDEVAIVSSASTGINPIASAIRFDDRPKVVMGEYEFPTMVHIWLAQQPRGAEIRFVSGSSNAIPAECYEQAIDERTAVVPVTQVSFVNGFRADIAKITRIAHSRGALVFLDGYQDCGTRPIDVHALDVDFFVTGTLKYLLGPPGLGFLYVRRSLIEQLTPTVTSWMGQRDAFAFRTQQLDLAPAARRFETGTPAIPNIYMARAALQLLQKIGLEKVSAQIETHARIFLQAAGALGIESKTPMNSVGPLVVLRAKDAAQVVARLAERGILVSARHDGVRFAFHVYNDLDDISKTMEALRENLDLMVRV